MNTLLHMMMALGISESVNVVLDPLDRDSGWLIGEQQSKLSLFAVDFELFMDRKSVLK